MKSKNMTIVPVKSVKIYKVSRWRKQAELMVDGYLPTPAYELDHVEVNIEDDEIQLTPWAQHDPDKVVIQMSVPFQKRCKIRGLCRNQTYRVIVEGSENAETENIRFTTRR